MAAWRKLLERMRASQRCEGFTYEDARRVLLAVGYTQVSTGGGSHRRYAKLQSSGVRVIITLVEKGHGTLKAVYIKDMLGALDSDDAFTDERSGEDAQQR